ncbi:MAG: sugar ABC transporter substrate-binding protein [Treponema sp.]|nr:sugar ABC transporter substrate-binding protein [Treponema sp.]
MKRILAVLLAVSLVFLMGACSSRKSNDDDGILIGVSMSMLDENFSSIFRNFERFATQTPNVKVVMTNAESSTEREMGNVESLIIQEPDVILIGPVDSIGSIPAVQAIVDAGIPCVDFLFNVQQPLPTIQAITADELTFGHLQGDFVNEWLETHPNVNLIAGYIKGAQAQTDQLKRYTGFVERCIDRWAEEDPNRIKLIVDTNCNWTAPEAMAVTEDWLQANPEINCIIAASDEMAVGVINVLDAQGRNHDDFLVVSVDGTENGQNHVRAGTLDATIFTNYVIEMEKMAQICIDLATGNNKYEQNLFIGDGAIFIITPDNIQQVIPQ